MKHGKETKTIKKPSLYIAMPCYDMVKIQTMISMVKLVAQLTKAGIKMEVNTMKSPYIAYARNTLTARFMESEYEYLLFIDLDVELVIPCNLQYFLQIPFLNFFHYLLK